MRSYWVLYICVLILWFYNNYISLPRDRDVSASGGTYYNIYRRMFPSSFKKLVLRRGRLSGVRWMIVAPDNNNLRLLRRTLRTLLLVHHECLMLMNNKTLTLSGAGAALSPEFSKNILH